MAVQSFRSGISVVLRRFSGGSRVVLRRWARLVQAPPSCPFQNSFLIHQQISPSKIWPSNNFRRGAFGSLNGPSWTSAVPMQSNRTLPSAELGRFRTEEAFDLAGLKWASTTPVDVPPNSTTGVQGTKESSGRQGFFRAEDE